MYRRGGRSEILSVLLKLQQEALIGEKMRRIGQVLLCPKHCHEGFDINTSDIVVVRMVDIAKMKESGTLEGYLMDRFTEGQSVVILP
jgi:hypothetical protein